MFPKPQQGSNQSSNHSLSSQGSLTRTGGSWGSGGSLHTSPSNSLSGGGPHPGGMGIDGCRRRGGSSFGFSVGLGQTVTHGSHGLHTVTLSSPGSGRSQGFGVVNASHVHFRCWSKRQHSCG